MHYLSLAIGIVLNAAANILIKSAMRQVGDTHATGVELWRVVVSSLMPGVACFGVALVAYAYALKRIDLSIGYPAMTSLGLLIVVAYSAFVFHEPVAAWRLFGVGLIIAGVVVVFSS